MIGHVANVFAYKDITINNFLEVREKEWPEWVITSLKYSDLKKDLVYPSWFEGTWLVKSENFSNSSEEPLYYQVNFYRNESNQIIGRRAANSESIGKALFGDRLLKVKNDPESFNNQIVYLRNDEYIDSRIIGRTQIEDENLFFSDELAIQTVYKSGISRINQVEVMSKFYKCDEIDNESSNLPAKKICGSQYLATYGSKLGELNLKAVTSNKYALSFTFIGY